MWSQVYLDANFHTNFHTGFSSHKNDVHIQLSQWQYWWWFWFAAVWVIYFFIILRCYNQKTENYNITLNTSMRSHGKWGDFLIALIPLSWCGNILINSNFILRMLEWQNEGSLFVLRIQGKQWYWAYKYSADTSYRLYNVYINVGNNNWLKLNSSSNKLFNNNNSISHFIYDYEFKQLHKQKLEKKLFKIYKLNKTSFNNDQLSYYTTNHNINIQNISFFNYLNKKHIITPYIFNNKIFKLNIYNTNKNKNYTLFDEFNVTKAEAYQYNLINNNNNFNLFIKNKLINYHNYFEMDEIDNDYIAPENFKIKNLKFSIRLLKGILNQHSKSILNNNTLLQKNIFLNYIVNNTEGAEKEAHLEQFWGFRQKKYKKLKAHKFALNNKYNNKTYQWIESYSKTTKLNKYNVYTSFKNNKYKNELIPVTLAKRLLRTKRTLILPVHINITIITNSYDVVHSWFVPGLGLKIDCVPGRSTHHSLYVDTVGFYYGQCAEICGRYHHHMPIRVCALPFEHFMLWWQTKGLPRMYRSELLTKKKTILLTKFKY